MEYNTFLHWCSDIVQNGAKLWSWLSTPIEITSDLSLSPILLVSIGGLTAFIGLAIIKWLVS